MKILASKARYYLGLEAEYQLTFAYAFHMSINDQMIQLIIKLCNNSDFKVDMRDYEGLLTALLYKMIQVNQLWSSQHITPNDYYEWSGSNEAQVEAWQLQCQHWGISAYDYKIAGLNFSQKDLIKLDAQDYLSPSLSSDLDYLDAEIAALSDAMDDPLAGKTLLDILARYPETEEGYHGVMREVGTILELYEQKLAPKLAIAETEAHYNLWYFFQARPYLRLLFELMDFHRAIDMLEEGLAYGKRLLQLSPADNLHVHEVLIPLTIQLGDYDYCKTLIESFENDELAGMLYNRALFAYAQRQEGAEALLRSALAANQYVPAYIIGAKQLPYDSEFLPEQFEPGDETEAILYTYNAREAWLDVAGAINFMQQTKKKSQQTSKVIDFKKRR